MSRTHRTAIVAAAFAASGAAALVYQVVWQRILALQTGVGIVSITAITAAFMLGLGIGNYWGGILSERLSVLRALKAFAAVELSIGIFGAFSTHAYYDGLYTRATALYESMGLGLLLHFIALLPPTILMGMSLPLLVKGTSGGERSDRTVDLLYALNTLGAAAGAFVTPVLLLRHTSTRGAVIVAAAANVAAAVASWVTVWGRAASEPAPTAARATSANRYPPLRWLVFYALSGFVALGLEVVWFRLSAVGIKATAFTFGAVLCVYLVGLGAGGLVGRRLGFVARAPLRAFLLAQCFIGLFAALPVVVVGGVTKSWPLLGWFPVYWAERFHFLREHGWDTVAFLRLHALLPGLLFAIPTLLMGISFCALQKAVANEGGTTGFRVGVLQAANIAGCVAGSLVVGLLTLDAFGTIGSLRILVACAGVFAVVGLVKDSPRLFLPITVGLAGLAIALPSAEGLWRTLHGRHAGRFFFNEDRTGVVGLSMEPTREWYVWIDGMSLSWLPFGGIHTLLGAVPALVHPQPRTIAVVGLGSGNTAWAAGCRRGVERITVFEIMRPQGTLLRRLDADERPGRPPRLRPFLADSRITMAWKDGRHALTHDETRYDIIEADALLPETAGSGNLYSAEFFKLAARRLKPGGLMCTWGPSPHVAAAFHRAFPHVVAFSDEILVGSLTPFRLDPSSWLDRARDGGVIDYLGPRNSRATIEAIASATARRPPSDDVPPNRDLAPWDEFARRR